MGAFLTFIDTSAIVARLANEPKAGDFARRISGAQVRFTSGLVILETSMRLSTLLDVDPVLVESRIRLLLAEAEISIVPIDGRIATASVLAIAAYGKGRGHPAQLNFADCMSYAFSKVHDMPLLFKVKDFSRTDIETA